MDHFDEAFERTSLQKILGFILTGGERRKTSSYTYEQRLRMANNIAFEKIAKKFPDLNEFEMVKRGINDYVSETKDVYMEVGMRCGAELILRLLGKL